METATFQPQNGFSSQNLAMTAKKPSSVSHQGNENNKVATDWDSYLSAISGEIVEVQAARIIAQQDYERVLAEVDAWSRRLEIAALNNSHEDSVRQSLLRRTNCKDRAHQLKVLIEQYDVQISILESQLAMWGQQVARDVWD